MREVSVLIYSQIDFKEQDILHSERGAISDSDFTWAVLSVNVLVIREHKHYDGTVQTLRVITVAWGRFSQPVRIPSIYSSAVICVA